MSRRESATECVCQLHSVSRTGVLEGEVLVSEFLSIDGLSTAAITHGEVTSLGHEARDNSVEVASLVVEGFSRISDAGGTVAESSEVSDSLGDHITEKTKDNTAFN